MRGNSNLTFLLTVFVGLTGYLGYVVYNQQIPCVTPITYQLVGIDKQFGLSEEKVRADIDEAAAVWNKALGREVLVKGEHPTLPVSFVYTSTQQTVDSIASIEEDIDQTKAELTKVANEYGALKKQYDALNSRGRATKEMYDQLTSLRDQYNNLRDQINADIARGSSLPQGEVEEGKYIRDADGTRIYIYAYQDKTELMRTLTHEFGHSLGLEHVENQNSIMYRSSSQSTSLTLSQEDVAELTRVCNEAKELPIAKAYLLAEPLFTQLEPFFDQLRALAK